MATVGHRAGRRLAAAALITVSALMTAAPALLGAAPAAASPSVIPVPGSTVLDAVHCTSASYCFAIGLDGSVSVLTFFIDGTEGGVVDLPGFMELSAMDCPSVADCFAVGSENDTNNPPEYSGGVVVPFIYGEPQTPIQISGTSSLSAIACDPGTTTCVAVGSETYSLQNAPYRYGTVVALSNGNPTGAVQQESNFLSFSSIACPVPGSCLAAGTAFENLSTPTLGGILPVANGVAGTATTTADTYGFGPIACESATACVTGGVGPAGAQVMPITSGTLGSPTVVTAIGGFDKGATCPTPTLCYLTASTSSSPVGGLVLPVTAGVPGTPQTDIAEGTLEGLSCVSADACVGVGQISSNDTGVIVTSAVPTPPATISSVAFSGSGYGETLTVKGANFGVWAPDASPIGPTSCVKGQPSYDYAAGVLAFIDTTGSWSAGAPGDCTGLVVKSWSDTRVVLSFGAAYVWPLLQNGDGYQLSLLGSTLSGTASIPAAAAPSITSVVIAGIGATSPVVTVVGTNLGSRVPVPNPLTPINCVSGDTSHDYPAPELFFNEIQQGWTAGETGDCIGINVTKWTPTKVVFRFGAAYPDDIALGDPIQVGLLDAVFTGTALSRPAPTVSKVSVSGTSAVPSVTITGNGFGASAPAPDPSTPVTCVAGDTSFTYPVGQLSFSDNTQGWDAGQVGDCIGLVVTSWSTTKVVYAFGADYPNVAPVTAGDAFTVSVEGTTVSGTAAV